MTRTALHVVTDWPGHYPRGPHSVGVLVDNGADVNARLTGPHAETPLHWAASSDDVAVLDALLNRGADIEADGAVIGGGTALMTRWRSERETLARLNALKRRRELGEDLSAAPRTLGEWLTEWLSTKERDGTRPTTLRGYRWLIETHIRAELGRIGLEKVTPTMIRRLLSSKRDAGLSASTVKHIQGMIRNVLADAEREELVHRNAARAVRAPSVRPVERRVLPVEDARRLIESIRGDRLEALWLCALTVGLRRGELLGLRWSDIDFESRTLAVRQTVLRLGGKLTFSEPKTDRSRRRLPVPEQVIARLRSHRARQASERLAAGERWRDFDLVFASTVGTPLEPRNVDRSWQAARERVGLSWLRLHDLRHACATFMLAAGASPRTAMKTLGHSQIALTMNTYAHVLPEVERAAVDDAAERLFG